MDKIALAFSLSCLWAPLDQTNLGIAHDRVDLIEINHFYDEKGKLVFNQVIYYDWSDDQQRYNVRDWKLLNRDGQVPVRDWARGGYVSVWYEGDLLRVVRAPLIRETWTQYDPELVEREFLPKDRRAQLSKPASPRVIRR